VTAVFENKSFFRKAPLQSKMFPSQDPMSVLCGVASPTCWRTAPEKSAASFLVFPEQRIQAIAKELLLLRTAAQAAGPAKQSAISKGYRIPGAPNHQADSVHHHIVGRNWSGRWFMIDFPGETDPPSWRPLAAIRPDSRRRPPSQFVRALPTAGTTIIASC